MWKQASFTLTALAVVGIVSCTVALGQDAASNPIPSQKTTWSAIGRRKAL